MRLSDGRFCPRIGALMINVYKTAYETLHHKTTKKSPDIDVYLSLNPNQTGGGGVESTPPSTFRAIISRIFFSPHRAFATFFFRVLRNF